MLHLRIGAPPHGVLPVLAHRETGQEAVPRTTRTLRDLPEGRTR